LHDEKPERTSRFFDETIVDCSFGSVRGRACGKCRQRSLKPPSKPAERRRPFLGNFVFKGCPSRTKRIQRHRARSESLSVIPYLLVGKGPFKSKTFPQSGRDFLSRLFDLDRCATLLREMNAKIAQESRK
jgi:hypothetical protein